MFHFLTPLPLSYQIKNFFPAILFWNTSRISFLLFQEYFTETFIIKMIRPYCVSCNIMLFFLLFYFLGQAYTNLSLSANQFKKIKICFVLKTNLFKDLYT